ncbi:DUF7662 domain-containing protein [Deinococcus apachensis]|uniref:DUF7662 domain-containing protein n=1 Tax=Deinococcus apachensis TaxID=309886 RepID=UPI000374C3A2|nr:hypothetical protein [Deinococcus apachensis]
MRTLQIELREDDRTLLTTELETHLTAQELLRLLPTLLATPAPAPPPKVSPKYAGLAQHLRTTPEDHLTLSFQAIEDLLQGPLPESARRHRAWWSNNTRGHSQAAAWLNEGWQVMTVQADHVTFQRTGATS